METNKIVKNKNENHKASVLSSEEVIGRYFEQPGRLPIEVENEVSLSWQGDTIQLFAMADFDQKFQLVKEWFVLGRKNFGYFRKGKLETWKRSDLKEVREQNGLSASRVTLLGEDRETPLKVLRFSQRQRKAFAPILYVLDQQTESGEEVLGGERKGHSEIKAKGWERTGRKETNGRGENKGNSLSGEKIYQEAMLKSLEETQSLVSKNKYAVIFRLLNYLKPYRKQVAWGMTGAMFLTLMSLVPAYLTGYVLDNVIKPQQLGQISYEEALKLSMFAIGGLALVYLVREFFAWVRLRWMAVLGELVARDLRRDVYNHLHKLSLSFFSSKQVGSLISRVSSDTDRIWDFIAFGVVEVASSLLMLAGLGGVLIFLDWKMGLIVVLPVPFVLWRIIRHGEEMQRLFLRAWRRWSDVTDCLSDTIPGIRVVKAFNQQNFERQKFNGRNEAVVGEFNRIHRAWTGFWPRLMLSLQGIIVLVWFFGVPRVLGAGSEETFLGLGGLTAGTFVSFVLYLTMFVQPIEVIGQMARMVNRATSSAHRVFEVLDTKPQLVEIENPIVLDEIKGAVEFRNASFSYDGVRPVLKDMSFKVQPGEFIGLVGPSGGGKTTLTNLMTRFYDLTSGQILIDGVGVEKLDLTCFRDQVGMVLQEPYLFHGTLLDNIRYAKPNATLFDVIEAAEAAHAHEFICRLSHGYDTMIGERGHTLSGGERQRISIARAILRNPRILILDEATSAVDTETECKIQDAMDNLVKGRTVFAIAHRLSTLRKADRLFVIKKGELVEQGTHSELVDVKDGVYAKLYKMQQRSE